MKILYFPRVFTNNYEYEGFDTLEYMDSMAYTVQEFLYTSKVKDEDCDFRMSEHVKLYDFMTMSYYFIKNSNDEFGRSTIQSMTAFAKRVDNSSQEKEMIDYKNDEIILSNVSCELMMALLWTAFVYASVINHLFYDNAWGKTAKMLLEEIQEFSHHLDKHLNIHLLMLQADKAIQFMSCHIVDKHGIEIGKEKEIEQNGQDIAQEPEPYIVEPQQKEEAKVEDDVAEEIILHDKVRLDLLLRLMKNDGANIDKHGNKMKAAQIMQSITGLPLQTCKNYCSNRDLNVKTHSEEVLKMNTLLQALGMKIRL